MRRETGSARRAFLLAALVALTTRAWPAQAKRLGVFIQGTEEEGRDIVALLAKALRSHGWREGVNLEIVLVALGANPTPEAAAALLRVGVDALFTANNIPARMLKQATSTIPIVAITGDPVSSGFAKSLTRPGGNFTGLAFSLRDIQLKSLELARTFIPRLSRFRLVGSEADQSLGMQPSLARETQHTGVVVERANVVSLEGLAQGFKGLSVTQRGAAFVTLALLPFDARQVAELAIARKVATFSPYKQEVRDGLLASYSRDFDDEMARVAAILDKVLRGAKPAEIPFEQPTQTHIAINKRTAAALGLAIPPQLLVRADEVIS
jgi:putative tryptophan/tyrosine transport system substrate-binding protein